MKYESITNPREMKLKAKHRTGFTFPKHAYRQRTGPRCCNANCPSSKKKSGIKGRVTSFTDYNG